MKVFDVVLHIPTQRRVTINLLGKGGAGMVGVTFIAPNERGEMVEMRENVPWQTLRHLTPEEKAEVALKNTATDAHGLNTEKKEMPAELLGTPVVIDEKMPSAEGAIAVGAPGSPPEDFGVPHHKRKGK